MLSQQLHRLDLLAEIAHTVFWCPQRENSMPSTPIIPISKARVHEGEIITIRGWVENVRMGGRVAFLEMRDGVHSVQVVFAGEHLDETTADALRHLNRESVVTVRGEVHLDARAATGVELHGHTLTVHVTSPKWPLRDADDEQRIDARHLYLRSRRMRAAMQLRALLSHAIRNHLRERDFIEVDAPIFTPNVVEESGNLFNAPNASAIAYLSQSGQLYNEAAAMAFGRVYSFGPVFRAERAPTHRHLAEFWMVEPEIAFGSLDTMIHEAEILVDAMLRAARQEGASFLNQLQRDANLLPTAPPPYARITYDEAIARIQQKGGKIQFGDDLDAAAEALLTQDCREPIWVTQFPATIKSFYMKRDPNAPDRVLAADLLAPFGVGEILGGGEREEDMTVLASRLQERGLSTGSFAWYLALRRYGGVPHSGFGMGLERALVWIGGLTHIDEAIAFPRLPDKAAP